MLSNWLQTSLLAIPSFLFCLVKSRNPEQPTNRTDRQIWSKMPWFAQVRLDVRHQTHCWPRNTVHKTVTCDAAPLKLKMLFGCVGFICRSWAQTQQTLDVFYHRQRRVAQNHQYMQDAQVRVLLTKQDSVAQHLISKLVSCRAFWTRCLTTRTIIWSVLSLLFFCIYLCEFWSQDYSFDVFR